MGAERGQIMEPCWIALWLQRAHPQILCVPAGTYWPSRGFVAQTHLSLSFPLSQTDLCHAHRHGRAGPGEAIEQCSTHLQRCHLSVKGSRAITRSPNPVGGRCATSARPFAPDNALPAISHYAPWRQRYFLSKAAHFISPWQPLRH